MEDHQKSGPEKLLEEALTLAAGADKIVAIIGEASEIAIEKRMQKALEIFSDLKKSIID